MAETKLSDLFLMGVLAIALVATPVAAQTIMDAQDFLNQLGEWFLVIIEWIFGYSGAVAGNVYTGNAFSDSLFLYILPFLLVFVILEDFLYLMGFFRKRTAQVISIILSLFAARFGVYYQLVQLIGTFLGSPESGPGVFIPLLTFMFILMFIWWVLGHILWGFGFAMAVNRSTKTVNEAIGAMSEIGKRLEREGNKQ